MSKYIPFTTEQKERAASVDLEEFLRRRGEKLITSGRDKRLASDHSITIRGCEWFDHATEQGGRAISFVKQFYGLSYPDAMSLLLGDDLGGSYPAAREKEPEPAKPFTLPAQSESMRRVYAYLLQKRCIVIPAKFIQHSPNVPSFRVHTAAFPRHAACGTIGLIIIQFGQFAALSTIRGPGRGNRPLGPLHQFFWSSSSPILAISRILQ